MTAAKPPELKISIVPPECGSPLNSEPSRRSEISGSSVSSSEVSSSGSWSSSDSWESELSESESESELVTEEVGSDGLH
ncbi:MAG: hypothetical protein CSA83_03045 [Actinomycetales bacterium]|nr:MAG: hypothetical protein CSA83_03045 [Actinomycetales bacterium]